MWKCKNCGEIIESDFLVCWNCQFSKDGSPPHFAQPVQQHKEIAAPVITFPFGVRLYRASFLLVTLGVAVMPFAAELEGAPFNRSFIPAISFYLSIAVLCVAFISMVVGRVKLGHNPESYGVQLTDVFRQAFFGMFLFIPFVVLAMISPLLFVGGILFCLLYTWYWAGSTKEVEKVKKTTAEKFTKEILSGEGAEHFGSIVDEEVHGIIADAYLYFGPEAAKRMISTLSINDLKDLIEAKKRTNA